EQLWLHDALLGEQLLERTRPRLDRRKWRGMGGVGALAHAASSQRSHRSTWTASLAPPSGPQSSRAANRTPYAWASHGRSTCAATSGGRNTPATRTPTPPRPGAS